jgi:hypothetical protein
MGLIQGPGLRVHPQAEGAGVTEVELQTLIDEERAGEEARREMLRTPDDLLGPRVRDEAIFQAVYLLKMPPAEVAEQFGLAARTVQNIARQTQRRLARTECRWGRMSPAELAEERERLLALHFDATEAFEATARPQVRHRMTCSRRGIGLTTITASAGEPRYRFLTLAERAMTDLAALDHRVERALAAQQAARPAEQPAEQPAAAGRPAYAKRTRRRKSLSGRVLRLPRFVRARRLSSAALVAGWVRIAIETGPVRCRGDPRRKARQRMTRRAKGAAWRVRANGVYFLCQGD